MIKTPDSSAHLHYVFVYCDEHDQGAIAIITNTEWLDISTSSESNNYYYEKIFKYVITMCGSECNCSLSWRCCGNLEYIPQGELLIGKESVHTNFNREGGGWKFTYFGNELYTSQGRLEENELPSLVREFLT
jgi:hypothetical protein